MKNNTDKQDITKGIKGSPFSLLGKARQKGLGRSARLAANIAVTQTKIHTTDKAKHFIFIGHHMDNTGAPIVLMEVINEYAAKYGGKNVRLVSSHVAPNHLSKLHKEGVRIDKAALALGNKLIGLQLGIKKNDFVLMNTIAIYDNYRDFIFHELETGKLDHAFWFIHEDKGQIQAVNPNLLLKRNVRRINHLISSGKLTVVTPSLRTKEDYDQVFETKEIKSMPLLVNVPQKYRFKRKAEDYQDIRFLLSGYPADGRKGQLIAIVALNDFKTRYYDKNPGQYRNYSLHLVSISDDYVSQQICWIGKSLFGNKIHIYPQVPREEALEITSSCNAVICCSLNETFGLYVAEGMFMGHVVLRNNSAGMEEQLKDGVNGYFIDHKDIHQFADVIEKVLNKSTNSNESLRDMGLASQDIIGNFSDSSYVEKIDSL